MRDKVWVAEREVDKLNSSAFKLRNYLLCFRKVDFIIFVNAVAVREGETVAGVEPCCYKKIISDCAFNAVNTFKIKPCAVFKASAIKAFTLICT